MNSLQLHRLEKRYRINGQEVRAVRDIDLRIQEGEFVAVVGRSGCGKTTLLRLICGLEQADNGQAVIHNNGPIAGSHRVGIVFQEPRLMPWLTVRENIALALINEKDRKKTGKILDELLETLGLSKFQDAYPRQISGGMAQRTALGRTLCMDSDIILMDEPFGALDAFTRRKLQEELVDIFLNRKKTIIFVTHDVDEAVLLGQRILVMEQGQITCDIANALSYPRDVLSSEFLFMREKIIRTIFTPKTKSTPPRSDSGISVSL